jgi:hypothetical protein
MSIHDVEVEPIRAGSFHAPGFLCEVFEIRCQQRWRNYHRAKLVMTAQSSKLKVQEKLQILNTNLERTPSKACEFEASLEL